MPSHQNIIRLLSFLGVGQDQVSFDSDPDRLNLKITVPDTESGILIGHHGETIDSLQTIVALILNHTTAQYQPIMVDVNSYRENRLKYLEELAHKASAQAVESGREIILPPLSSFERRHIHLSLQDDAQVETYSEGDGLNRRLIIRPVKSS